MLLLEDCPYSDGWLKMACWSDFGTGSDFCDTGISLLLKGGDMARMQVSIDVVEELGVADVGIGGDGTDNDEMGNV